MGEAIVKLTPCPPPVLPGALSPAPPPPPAGSPPLPPGFPYPVNVPLGLDVGPCCPEPGEPGPPA